MTVFPFIIEIHSKNYYLFIVKIKIKYEENAIYRFLEH